ncbi:Pycsar system effector family protein [Streptomyces sp. NPDC028722]|uniref:Pycsar system effector family protein n=1 Tax=Streptomyces sp. NPDC028722 TaxID=3155016 RepID=UPI0033CF3C40
MTAPDQALSAMHAEVKAEIARTDTKTGLLLAFVGAVLAGAWSIGRDVPLNVIVCIVGGLGLAVLATSAGLLLRSTRPNLRGRHGFPLWATLTADQVATAAASRELSAEVAGLSQLAVAKFADLRRAIDLVYVGGALLILAVLFALGGAA